jgi:hypothetical protein
MTLQDKSPVQILLKNWLVRAIVPAFFLFSCGNEDNISAPGIGSEDNLSAILVDTFTIQTSTILRDSVSTSSASSLLVGQVENAAFGRTTCNAFLQTSFTGNNFITAAEPVYDSMVLVLRPNYIFGNPEATIKMGVHRLKEGFDLEKTYFNDESLEYDRKPLAEATFSARDIQSENLRIDLSELGEEFFNDRDANFFDDPLDFVDYFKGLALVTQVSEGSIVGFEVDPASSTTSTVTSGIFLYYRTSTDSLADSTFYKFPISVNYRRFNQIIHDRPAVLSPLKQSDQKIESSQTNDETFIIAGTGITNLFEFPTYEKLGNLHENLIVERAIIQIDGQEEDIEYYLPPEELFLFKLDSANNLELYNNEDVGSGPGINGIYSIDVTSYFSDLISGRETVTNLVTIPSQNGSTVNQLKFGAYQKSDSPIKLLVYYIPIE